MHFSDEGNLENLPFLDDIMNTPHSSEFKQPGLLKYNNENGNLV